MSDLDTRQIGRHVFLFPKQDPVGSEGSATIVAKPVDITPDLPKEFVRYLRALFDILDTKDSGLVKLSDIEARWNTSGSSSGLTGGVIQSLRQVTPRNGLLSFERLCSGFKRALKSQPANGKLSGASTKRSRSLPQLDALNKDWTSDSSEDSFHNYDGRSNGEIMDRIRSWRSANVERTVRPSDEGNSSTGSNSPSTGRASPPRTSSTKVYFIGNEPAAPRRNDITVRAAPNTSTGAPAHSSRTNGLVAQAVTKPGEIVAHLTGANGFTKFDKEKRLKELTEDNEVLHSGLEVVEKARKWYFKRITAVQEEKLHLKESEQYTAEQLQYEVLLHKTRRKELGLDGDSVRDQKAHIEEMSKCLTRLTNGQAAVKDSSTTAPASRKLLDEIQALRKELADKDAKIGQLEREKSELIRDLFNGKVAIRRAPSVLKNSKVL